MAPARYLATVADALRAETAVARAALPGEFLLNALRLCDGVSECPVRLPHWARDRDDCHAMETSAALGLMRGDRLAVTPLGLRFLDSVVSDVSVTRRR